jgi:hypothetical protein
MSLESTDIALNYQHKIVQEYVRTSRLKNDVFVGLQPLWNGNPEVKIYAVA